MKYLDFCFQYPEHYLSILSPEFHSYDLNFSLSLPSAGKDQSVFKKDVRHFRVFTINVFFPPTAKPLSFNPLCFNYRSKANDLC